MNDPKVYGWCPGALRPMMSGDGLVVRIRTPLGRLTAQQAQGIAQLSSEHGNGMIDLSARANLQLRGVSEDSHPLLIEGLTALGLIDRNIAAETRRNLVIEPFWQNGDETHHIAQALTKALACDDAPDLPGKFGFAVDCGPTPRLTDISADIRIECGAKGLICRADGAANGQPVTPETAADAAIGLARWFLDTGGAPQGRGRMSPHIARIGAPDGHTATRALPDDTTPPPGLTPTGALVALEFGQIQAETLVQLARNPIRLTPWRMLIVENTIKVPDVDGLITVPDDPRLRISACTGAPRCPQAQSPTRDIARQLAPHANTQLHIAGCTKGCAHPNRCDTTLTATAPGVFDLIRDGRASDTPVLRRLTVKDLKTGAL